MKKTLLPICLILCATLFSCEPKRGEYKIYPLSPFSSELNLGKNADLDKEIQTQIKTQYYIDDEDVDLTDRTKTRLMDFIKDKLSADMNNKAIYFTFYKGTFTFSRNSVQTKEELEANHTNDKLAEFEYKDGKLYNFDFFKDGTYYEQPPSR